MSELDGYFTLDENGNPKRCRDLFAWGKWMSTAERHVCETKAEDGTYISTVFLGVDHSFGLGGPPLLYETMIFNNPAHADFQERYTTKDEAVAGHERALALVASGPP